VETEIIKPNKTALVKAAEIIKGGGTVAFPTETVYGLGADALNAEAVKKIFEAKGRPSDNPLIVHIADEKQLLSVVKVLPALAAYLIDRFMPGPLTLVLEKAESIPDEVTAGLKTVAVRIPAHPAAVALIRAAGTPIAAPSANASGSPSPTKASHVYDDLNGKIAYILDGGDCSIGLESTIIDFSVGKPRLLRMGGIPLDELTGLSDGVEGEIEALGTESAGRPLAPGMKYRHYAPKARVYLFEYGDTQGVELLCSLLCGEGKRVALILNSQSYVAQSGTQSGIFKIIANETTNEFVIRAALMNDAEDYARRLFYELRETDRKNADAVICEKAVDAGIGRSVNNRLEKAADKL